MSRYKDYEHNKIFCNEKTVKVFGNEWSLEIPKRNNRNAINSDLKKATRIACN